MQLGLGRATDVEIGIYDLVGRRVHAWRATLPAGSHAITWDGRDDAGHETRNGFYLVRARSGSFESTARILRMR